VADCDIQTIFDPFDQWDLTNDDAALPIRGVLMGNREWNKRIEPLIPFCDQLYAGTGN
jgi:hypothetical protein